MGGSVQYDKRMRRYYIAVYWDSKHHKIWENPHTGEKFYRRNQAQKLLGRIQTDVDEKAFHPRFWKPDSPMLVKVYYLEWARDIDVSDKTRRDYRGYFQNHIVPEIGGYDIRRIRKKHLTILHRDLGEKLSGKGRYNVMGALRAMFRWAYDNEDISRVPPFPKLTYQKPEITYLTLEQQDEVLGYMPEHHRPIFEMAMEQGLRIQEVRALQRDCILPDAMVIKRAFAENDLKEETKTSRIRYVPMTGYAKGVLAKVPRNLSPFIFTREDGKPYTNKDMNAIWRVACKKAGIQIKLLNAVRHSLGCQLLDQGVDMDLVRDQYGHERSDMTARYAKRSVVTRAKALEGRRGKVVFIKR